mmetsp:Transcript_114089/g.322639  ORF Transcript_114089/g.322639 Transcript_114089/m.322639 type:complete len:455 (+) Transcript_114089:124-1488(+)
MGELREPFFSWQRQGAGYWNDGVAFFLTTYSAPKVVRIRAWQLQVPHILFAVLIFLVLLPYNIYHLKFMASAELVAGRSFIDISSPQRNFAKCHDGDFDCDDVGSSQPKLPGYCSNRSMASISQNMSAYFYADSEAHEYSKSRWPNPSDIETYCTRADIHDVWCQYNSAPMIATALMSLVQERCTSKECVWMNQHTTVGLTEDIEDFRVKIRSSFLTVHGAEHSSASSTGYLMIGGTPHIILCSKSTEGKVCNYTMERWKDESPRCGSQEPDSECFSTGFASFISLRMLLEAANVSLDAPLSGQLPRRWWGTAIMIDIHYMNDAPADFWAAWPPKPRLKYLITVTARNDFVWFAEPMYHARSHRTLIRRAGVAMVVSVHGNLAHFSLPYALSAASTFAVCFAVAKSLVHNVVVRVYRCTSLRHITEMYKDHRYEVTPHHSEYCGEKRRSLSHTV